MTRFADYTPQGVIPAALAAFRDDYSIDEDETRRHFQFLVDVPGINALTVNGHSSEVHACTFDEQARFMDLAADVAGDRVPLIAGIYADGSLEAARLARMAAAGGASALLCFPPHSLGMGCVQHRPEMAVAHFSTIAEASDLPIIVFQYGNELAYSLDLLVRLSETIPTIKAIKDWSPPQQHERHIRVLQTLSRPVNVLSTNSAWLLSSLVMGAKGLLSGAGSVIADLQVALFQAVQDKDLERAQALWQRIWLATDVFYADPFGDMHNRMKEALVILGRQNNSVVRPPLLKPSNDEIARIASAMQAARISTAGAEGLHALSQAAE